ncbi:hypothetical protein V6N13_090725 [Hibiscus sabdariffa]|uniref:Uncharacterized protein n=1 Tax=Hibiscus sabdariffa TaxID=183260 RepID=A0ABR1ZEA9_9ROSI
MSSAIKVSDDGTVLYETMCGNPRDCSFVVRFQVKQSISWQSPHSEGSMKLDVDRSASFSDPDHDVMDTNTAQLYEMKIAMEVFLQTE